MKVEWGSDTEASYNRLVGRVQGLASHHDAFDVTATQENYERLKKELTNGIVSDRPFYEGDGLASFAVAKTKDYLACHEDRR